MAREPHCNKTGLKRGPWSAEEDQRLKSYIEKHGINGGWVSLPLKAGLKRCGKSCRLRWLNYLRPGLKHGNYTTAEEKLICKLYSIAGSRWSIIASQLPGRTNNDVKNHWNTQLKHKWMARQLQPKWLSFGNLSWAHTAHTNAMFAFSSVEINFQGVPSASVASHSRFQIHSSYHSSPSDSFAAYNICRTLNHSSSTSIAFEHTVEESNGISCPSTSGHSCSSSTSFAQSSEVKSKTLIPNNLNSAYSTSDSLNQGLKAKHGISGPNNSNPTSSPSVQHQVVAYIFVPNNSNPTYPSCSAQEQVVTDTVGSNNTKARYSSYTAEEETLEVIEDVLNPPNSKPTSSSCTAQDNSSGASSDNPSLHCSNIDLFDVLVDLDFYGMDHALKFSSLSSKDSIRTSINGQALLD